MSLTSSSLHASVLPNPSSHSKSHTPQLDPARAQRLDVFVSRLQVPAPDTHPASRTAEARNGPSNAHITTIYCPLHGLARPYRVRVEPQRGSSSASSPAHFSSPVINARDEKLVFDVSVVSTFDDLGLKEDLIRGYSSSLPVHRGFQALIYLSITVCETQALVLLPTRELATQIQSVVLTLGQLHECPMSHVHRRDIHCTSYPVALGAAPVLWSCPVLWLCPVLWSWSTLALDTEGVSIRVGDVSPVQTQQSRVNDGKNAFLMRYIATADSFPDAEVNPKLGWFCSLYLYVTRVFQAQSLKSDAWVAPMRQEVLKQYTQLNEAIMKSNTKRIADLTMPSAPPPRRRPRSTSGPSTVKSRPRASSRCVRATGSSGGPYPRWGSCVAVQVPVRFDTEQSVEMYDPARRTLHAHALLHRHGRASGVWWADLNFKAMSGVDAEVVLTVLVLPLDPEGDVHPWVARGFTYYGPVGGHGLLDHELHTIRDLPPPHAHIELTPLQKS
ncbi:hypothetical protein B0H14DRAFT_2647641 [Mycena olivaceomarginata]|nr:hypothetical protein B0H14DRAFT_2647641 [Mycena olivaceomarginata]